MGKGIRRWWQACALGIILGVPIGIFLEITRRRYGEYRFEQMANEFESQGMSPPLMIDFLQPWFVPGVTTIIFAVAALVIYKVFMISRATH